MYTGYLHLMLLISRPWLEYSLPWKH